MVIVFPYAICYDYIICFSTVFKASGWEQEDSFVGEVILAISADDSMFGLNARHVGPLRCAFSLLNLGYLEGKISQKIKHVSGRTLKYVQQLFATMKF